MRPPLYSTAALVDLFRQHTVASLPEVMAALGTRARRTAFRKLKELPYRTSYSHRGGYYTLDELIDFDQHGLWSFRDVRFSVAGTLLATAAALVSDAPAGQFSEELDNLLHVGTQDVLRKLVTERKLSRRKLAGQFLYCAADRTRKAQQLSARRALLAAPGLVGPVPDADLMPDELRAAIVLFASLLDERQRRLYAGLESLKCGWGGDARIAGLLGIDPGTVARGRKQLLAQDVDRERVRRPGGGRPRLEKKTPEVITAIEAALQHDVAGDPITGIRWTHRTTEKIATELATLDIQVCPRTVARILKDLDYRLRVNHKRVSAGSGADREQQFHYIAEQPMKFAKLGLPIVSIDTKKRELVGNFKNQGTTWERSPQAVNDHDFRSQADGIAIPYGVYDVGANRGFVVVGTSHDTPDFAADNLVRWWQHDGSERYLNASRLLVLADSGGSNAPRVRAFTRSVAQRDGAHVTKIECPGRRTERRVGSPG